MSDLIHPNVKDPKTFALRMMQEVESKLQKLISDETDRVFRLVSDSMEAGLESDSELSLTVKIANTAFQNKDKPGMAKWQGYPKEYTFSHTFNIDNADKYLFQVAPDSHEHVDELMEDGRKHEALFWLGEAQVGEETKARFARDFTAGDFEDFCKVKEGAARSAALGVMLTALRDNKELLVVVARDAVAAADNKKTSKK